MRLLRFLFVLGLLLQEVSSRPPDPSASFRPEILRAMDQAVLKAVGSKKLPGGVLWLEHKGGIYRKAYGKRATVPADEAMTLDTIFDAASLTKVVATTPCILRLVEQERLSLEDKACKFLPELTGDPNKATITI